MRVHDRLFVSVADSHIIRLDLDVKQIPVLLDGSFIITVERLAGDRRLAFWLYDRPVPSIEAPIPLLEANGQILELSHFQISECNLLHNLPIFHQMLIDFGPFLL